MKYFLLFVSFALLAGCSTIISNNNGARSDNANSIIEQNKLKNITSAQLSDMLKQKDFFFVNVHTPYDGEIEKTDAFIAYNEISKNLEQLPKDKNAIIVLYCRSGRMSQQAGEELLTLGYTRVSHLSGGMLDWQNNDFPLKNKNQEYTLTNNNQNNQLYNEVVAKVLPEKGFQSKLKLGDSVLQLVQKGSIDPKKFETLYKDRGGLPRELQNVFTQSSNEPILLTKSNANIYLNLLWALGLSNYMDSNKDSPVMRDNGKSLYNFASTGGWTLGKEQNGGAYFNKFRIVSLTTEQEKLATKIAQSTYRPCCNNSTFFQDCNHGSALLGMLQLGASQGLSEEELYREALAYNSFWFPNNYVQTALYFKIQKDTDWQNADPKIILSKNYSSIQGWSQNVATEIAKIPNLLPQTKGGAGCGV